MMSAPAEDATNATRHELTTVQQQTFVARLLHKIAEGVMMHHALERSDMLNELPELVFITSLKLVYICQKTLV